jgi:hypothetical protein
LAIPKRIFKPFSVWIPTRMRIFSSRAKSLSDLSTEEDWA